MSSTQTATSSRYTLPLSEVGRAQEKASWRGSLVRTQQTLDERLQLSIETRVRYLEEDVVDNWYFMNENLKTVRDQGTEMVRKESEDFLRLHNKLNDTVRMLEEEINVSLEKAESDIAAVNDRVDVVEDEVEDNTQKYYRLNDGLYRTINYIRYVEDQLYLLKWKVLEMNSTLRELLLYHDEPEPEPEPSVGPISGIESTGRVMGEAEKAVMDWINEEQSFNDAASEEAVIVAEAESESESEESMDSINMSSFEELLNELIKYNM